MTVIIDPLKDIGIVWSVDGEYLRPMYAVDNLRRTKTSKWEPAPEFGPNNSPHVKCGNCGEFFYEYFKKFNFCPNCGAKMDGGQDDA